MRGFKLCPETGDTALEKGRIATIDGVEYLTQAVRQHLSTGQGEWFLDSRLGLKRESILGKNPNMDLLRDEIQLALLQLDDSFLLTAFTHRLEGRKLFVEFKVKSGQGQEIGIGLEV